MRAGILLLVTCFLVGLSLERATAQGVTSGQQRRQGVQTQKKAKKRISFAPDGRPWCLMLEWLADMEGLPVVAREIPKGTFEGPLRRIQRASDALDIVNEGLLALDRI